MYVCVRMEKGRERESETELSPSANACDRNKEKVKKFKKAVF